MRTQARSLPKLPEYIRTLCFILASFRLRLKTVPSEAANASLLNLLTTIKYTAHYSYRGITTTNIRLQCQSAGVVGQQTYHHQPATTPLNHNFLRQRLIDSVLFYVRFQH